MVGAGWLLAIKVLSALASPLVIAMSAIVAGQLTITDRSGRAQKYTRIVSLSAVIGLAIVSTPVVAKWLAFTLERQYPPQAIAGMAIYDVAIVLGGATREAVGPRLEIELGAAGNRIIHAARLYRAGKVRKILIAAGALSWDGSLPPEADAIGKLLIEFGVADVDLVYDRLSRTTLENARETRRLWVETGFRSGYLVTSALHMPRAMAYFRGIGLEVTPASTDVAVVPPMLAGPLELVPNAQALVLFSSAMHEWIGIAALQLRKRLTGLSGE